MSKITIESVSNGYVVEYTATKYVYKTSEEVFDALLQSFEGLSPSFIGKSYGKVIIERGKEDGSDNH